MEGHIPLTSARFIGTTALPCPESRDILPLVTSKVLAERIMAKHALLNPDLPLFVYLWSKRTVLGPVILKIEYQKGTDRDTVKYMGKFQCIPKPQYAINDVIGKHVDLSCSFLIEYS